MTSDTRPVGIKMQFFILLVLLTVIIKPVKPSAITCYSCDGSEADGCVSPNFIWYTYFLGLTKSCDTKCFSYRKKDKVIRGCTKTTAEPSVMSFAFRLSNDKLVHECGDLEYEKVCQMCDEDYCNHSESLFFNNKSWCLILLVCFGYFV
ncbi:uncharacterized protein LOC126740356 [Anthonomus grandis grandis]|uniref:uncharacterized protein LOC126740356 n=1 Tax=Anthonomus grandis grandis TaxID=2921223 RepID=UPI002166928F|nr:uncharacterized protein LOC126740356 [Anthonomus grandis grandis]